MRALVTAAVVSLALWGCSEQPGVEATPEKQATPEAPLFADADITEAVMGKWSRSCALCHVDGNGGAPRTGNVDEWRPRMAQGEAALLAHTIEGFNDMPPLGYCMACEREDFRAMIKMMAGDAG